MNDQVPQPWGRVTVERWTTLNAAGTHLHVFLDGTDITRRMKIAEADDVAGTIAVYQMRRAPWGGSVVRVDDEGQPILTIMSGAVAIVRANDCRRCPGRRRR